MHLHLLGTSSKLEVSFRRYRYYCVDLKSMALDVKVLFGNHSLVPVAAFSSRTNQRLQFRLRKLSSIILQRLTKKSNR